ncbi:MAG: 3-oxoacyl-acyl-carrier protein reductase [Puniceicoccaceae bacterium 5H]|nr:MAG: 3-oxoacyl-acyl-carrier protein reductase [Puniceicoccaceae bacterium 5H]
MRYKITYLKGNQLTIIQIKRIFMSNKLENKVAVVTGASKGIGAAIARALAAEGASVVVNYAADQAGADKVVQEIEAQGSRAVAIQADLAQPAEVERLFREAHAAFGRLDVLVNNAGIFQFEPLEAVTPDHFHRQFDLNVLGLLLSTKEAVRYIGEQGGSVINVSSVSATYAGAGSSVYSATKGAVNTLTLALSQELGPRKIRVNSLSPGMVETEGYHAAGIHDSPMRQQIAAETPLGRIGVPGDIAPVAAFLASDDAGWVSGQIIAVAGGHR